MPYMLASTLFGYGQMPYLYTYLLVEKKLHPEDILRELVQLTPLIYVYSTRELTLDIFNREGGGS